MTKYSTGSSGDPDPNDESASCSLCGSTENLTTDEVAGAKVVVCKSCASSDSVTKDESESNERNRSSSTQSENTDSEDSSGYTITNPDSSWVEDDRPDYGNAQTPYMVPDYDDRFNEALHSKDLTMEELAEETDVDLDAIKAVSEGEALSEDVGAKQIEVISKYLDIELAEQV